MPRSRLSVIVVLVLAGLGAAAFVALRRPKPPPKPPPSPAQESPHAVGMDHSFAAYLALVNAPEGNTPCETAYNAYRASVDAAEANQTKPIVLRLAPREQFLGLCAEYPEATQRCLAPAYIRKHRDDCMARVNDNDVARFKQMVELRTRGYEPVNPSETTPEAPTP